MENNLPPFYVGQRVVALKTSPIVLGVQIKRGDVYTVKEIFFCKCKQWILVVNEVAISYQGQRIMCCIENVAYSNAGGSAKYFAPILENFQSITLEKVLEQETKLISVN
jgi:hypothetical protein